MKQQDAPKVKITDPDIFKRIAETVKLTPQQLEAVVLHTMKRTMQETNPEQITGKDGR